MTYVELIVVLSIFAVLSSVVMFNYGEFQARVDIKNLASDIALKVVEAQKSSLSGLLPFAGYTLKPSYGVYFDTTTPTQLIYFADLNNDGVYNEVVAPIKFAKNIYNITGLKVVGCGSISEKNALSIVFKRPDSGATITTSDGPLPVCASYVQITVSSSNQKTQAFIRIYPSGRVQVN